MIDLAGIRKHVISMLTKDLLPNITYHDVEHTLDVAEQSGIIAKEEGITDEHTLLELQLAALYHDTGFVSVYNFHEELSCGIAREQLPSFGVDNASIDLICNIIMATKVPQLPSNHLQEIICDADLDYLGREDFFIISEKLHKEFFAYDIVKNEQEWQDARIAFLQSHSYFTKSSQSRRNPGKQKNLEYLIKMAK